MNKLKTSELTGAALDWAVAKCEGIEWWAAEEPKDGLFIDYERTRLYSPSSDWSQGGPLIAQHIFLLEDLGDYEWGATAANGCKCRGDTVLQAVCRAYVLATLGEEVEIPNELL